MNILTVIVQRRNGSQIRSGVLPSPLLISTGSCRTLLLKREYHLLGYYTLYQELKIV